MVTSEFWKKVGIHWGTLFTNKNADFWSDTDSYSADQWKLMESWLDEIYEDFVRKAADGRKMDFDMVDRVAKGRIWTGLDAMERGLVDEIGGLHEAIRAAKAAAQIPEDEQVGLKIFPVKRSLRKRLSRSGREGVEVPGLNFLQYLEGALESELVLHNEVLRTRSPIIE
jgi:ClpP class serine protease